MTVLALGWPAAFLLSVIVVVIGVVICVVTWQVFMTGRAGMR